MKVGHLFAQIPPPAPLDELTGIGRYHNQSWRWVCDHDPEWVWWIITESRHLLLRDVERELLSFLKGLTTP